MAIVAKIMWQYMAKIVTIQIAPESFIGVGVEKNRVGDDGVPNARASCYFFAYNSKHHVDTVFDHFTTMLVSLCFLTGCYHC